MNSSSFFSSVFPLGSHLCREPMPPMAELKRDMENLKKHGFNLIKLQENWMVDEPLEGHIVLSKYEELIDYAGRLDMGVYLGLTCEQAPGWLYHKYPDCRMVGRNGLPIFYEAQTTLPADGKPGPCYDHPGAMSDQLRFIQKLVVILGKYENVVVWNTWQEIGYWSMMLAGQQVCYCENTLTSFRRWLEQLYGDLDGLNRAWNTRYGDWKYVSPDRGAYGQNALPQDIDWRYFMDNVQVANVLTARAQAIKEADPLKRPVFAHKGGIGLAHGHDWIYARTQDFLGSSCYPAWWPMHAWDDGSPAQGGRLERHTALLNEMWQGVGLTFDHIRSCNPPDAPVWAAEFQGGPVSTMIHKGRVPSPADMRRWMLTAISSGVTAISFWVTRAEIMAQETNGFSLLDSTGDTTRRLEEAARIGAALNRHADLFSRPRGVQAQVAIINNEWNAQFCTTCPPAYDHLSYSTRGWYSLLWECGIPLDFVEISQVDVHTAGQYKVLVLPYPLSLSEEAAGRLARYVEAGGCLISEANPGRIGQHGQANRGELSPLMAQLFGVKQESYTMVREPGDQQRWLPKERTWGEFLDTTVLKGVGPLAGQKLLANHYLETFIAESGLPVLEIDGKIAGVTRTVGKGCAWLLGTCVGHSGTAYRSPEGLDFIRALLKECGVLSEHSGRLLLRRQSVPGKQAWIFTNPTREILTEKIIVGDAVVEDLFGEKLTSTAGELSLTVESLDVRVLILKENAHMQG